MPPKGGNAKKESGRAKKAENEAKKQGAAAAEKVRLIRLLTLCPYAAVPCRRGRKRRNGRMELRAARSTMTRKKSVKQSLLGRQKMLAF